MVKNLIRAMVRLKLGRWVCGLLLVSLGALSANARVVWVNEGTGQGFLFNHRGNCYVILPTHVHGRGAVKLSARDPAGIGTGRIIHKAQGADLSLGIVSGSLTADCGQAWGALPQGLDLAASTPVTVIRYEQGSVETIRSQITTVTFSHFDITPQSDETRFFAARTSGAFVFRGTTPVGMVIEAGTRDAARVLRMDEIYARLRRVVEDWYEDVGCTNPEGCGVPEPDLAPPSLSGFRLTEWSAHGLTADQGPEAMVAGTGPYVVPLSPSSPVTLTFEADEIREVSRIVVTSDADGSETFSPKLVIVRIDTSAGGIDRWRNFLSPRDMVPGEVLDLRRGPTYARRVQIEIRSSWGGSPVRIDGIGIE